MQPFLFIDTAQTWALWTGQHENDWALAAWNLLIWFDQRESQAVLALKKVGADVTVGAKGWGSVDLSGQAESPSPLSRRRHWPLPLVGRYLGHNPLPPAPPKGDWPVEADQARLTLPGQPRISRSDHSLFPDPCGRLRGLGMTISFGGGGCML